MPELPEAETIARALHAALAGSTIRRARLLRRDFLKTGSPRGFARLVGARLAAVTRRGKYVVLDMCGPRLVLQLGMSGRVVLCRPGEPAIGHTHVVLTFRGAPELRYVNVRRIAAGVHLLGPGREGLLAKLGPDADRMDADEFVRRVAGRRARIKAVLLDQSVMAGVGNIYSDEALFRAGVRPTRRVNRIARAALTRVHATVREVLAEAIAAGGSTLADSTPFAGANGELGYFTLAHRVYGRYGEPCTRCGHILRRTTVAGRTTTYCPSCQR